MRWMLERKFNTLDYWVIWIGGLMSGEGWLLGGAVFLVVGIVTSALLEIRYGD